MGIDFRHVQQEIQRLEGLQVGFEVALQLLAVDTEEKDFEAGCRVGILRKCVDREKKEKT
ncbi:hypothetical protein AGMMS50239_07610 [Bacteroidia bacterium]|nr:hypothetical protein AGMMS50239_07610 [Bacteroidia bacterium]